MSCEEETPNGETQGDAGLTLTPSTICLRRDTKRKDLACDRGIEGEALGLHLAPKVGVVGAARCRQRLCRGPPLSISAPLTKCTTHVSAGTLALPVFHMQGYLACTAMPHQSIQVHNYFPMIHTNFQGHALMFQSWTPSPCNLFMARWPCSL